MKNQSNINRTKSVSSCSWSSRTRFVATAVDGALLVAVDAAAVADVAVDVADVDFDGVAAADVVDVVVVVVVVAAVIVVNFVGFALCLYFCASVMQLVCELISSP